MGYTTTFGGAFIIEPPLNEDEVKYLQAFNATRRMKRTKGQYYVGDPIDQQDDVLEYNTPPDGQPSLWCQWTVSDDGTRIMWDEGEKAYNMTEWLTYIIDHFLKPGAVTSNISVQLNHRQLRQFTYDHVVNGSVSAAGEDPGDLWMINVTHNVVSVGNPFITFITVDGRSLSQEVTW